MKKKLDEKYKKNKTKEETKEDIKTELYITLFMIVSEIVGVIVCHMFNIPVSDGREIRRIGSMILFIPFILSLLILIPVMIIEAWKETKKKIEEKNMEK